MKNLESVERMHTLVQIWCGENLEFVISISLILIKLVYD